MIPISEAAFKDWLDILKRANGLDLLQDPYGIWLEAFHAGTMLERQRCAYVIQTQLLVAPLEEFDGVATMTVHDAKQLQHSVIKQAIAAIAADKTAH